MIVKARADAQSLHLCDKASVNAPPSPLRGGGMGWGAAPLPPSAVSALTFWQATPGDWR
jgi:hypothetical protein